MAGIKSKFHFVCLNLVRINLYTLVFVELLILNFFHVSLCSFFDVQALVCLAFAGSLGITFIILACALNIYSSWWPLFVVVFYALSPIPTMIARRSSDGSGSSNACMEMAVFLTIGVIVSSFALPIVLARIVAIQWGACYLTLAGNFVVYATLLGFFLTFDNDDSDYNMW